METHLTSKQATWNWTWENQKDFVPIFRETLLVYPNFSKPFVIHTDASKVQLGVVISQDRKPIAFYRRKLNPVQVIIQSQKENHYQ